MAEKVVVRSDTDNHVLFSIYKVYYPAVTRGEQPYTCHQHADLEISCILDGTGIYSCDGTDYAFSPGDVIFHRVNEGHYIKVFDKQCEEVPSLIVIRFDSRFVWSPGGEWSNRKYLQLFLQKSSLKRRIPHEAAEASVICSLLAEMFEECCGQAPSYDLVVKAKLMTILANMARYFHDYLEESRELTINQRNLVQMEKSTSYILSHLSEPLTLDVLAKEACMSRSYYCTTFKTLNGQSVWDYITSQRIDLAQYQLENTNLTVLQISQNCGFNSITNFNRAFKKITGKTPMGYRRAVASGQYHREESP